MESERTTTERKQLKFESSWDDGKLQDMQLAALLKKFNLPAVFYISTLAREISDSQILELAQDFEIGGHTMTHPQDLKQVIGKDIVWEISENKKELEELLGKQITKFCYPRGRYNDRVVEVVRKAGYTEARTTQILKTIFLDPFRKGTTIHVFQRPEYMGVNWFILAQAQAEIAAQNGYTFHIWGHSWEIDRDGNWDRLEEFFDWLKANYQIV